MNRIRVAVHTFAFNHPVTLVAASAVITAVTLAIVVPTLEKNLADDIAEQENDPNNY